MTECQRETGVVNGLRVAGASWLRVNGSILKRKAEQGKPSEPSVSKDRGRQRGRDKLREREACLTESKRKCGEEAGKQIQIRRLKKGRKSA